MPHDPRTEQRVGAIVREELALFWEDLGQRFQKLGAGFRSALENYDSALQSHDRKHQELQQFLLRLALGRWWVGDPRVAVSARSRSAATPSKPMPIPCRSIDPHHSCHAHPYMMAGQNTRNPKPESKKPEPEPKKSEPEPQFEF